jgi:hypothetical protein
MARSEQPAAPKRAGWNSENRQNHLYKPFLRGSLIAVLTIGCTFGAINLAVMGFGADLHAVWTSLIQAHAYSQMFGWVGLFIMGIAYHTMTRFWLRPLRRPALVRPAFVLVVAGLVLRFLSQPFASNPVAAAVMVTSAVLGLAGVSLFVWAMFETMHLGDDSSHAPSAAKWFMAVGFAWLWLASLATVVVLGYLAAQGLDTIPPDWDAPYLRITLGGAIVTIIMGYTLRTVPAFMGLRIRPPGVYRPVLVGYTGAIVLEALGESGALGPVSGVLRAAGGLGELAALGAFVWLLNLYAPRARQGTTQQERNPWPTRFIKTAYAWLLIAACLNAAFGVAGLAAPVPHAFVASYHHALTVGFISLMIVGMSMRLVPVFVTRMMRNPAPAGVIFALLLGGNTLRVLTESLAYLYGEPYYLLMGLSGFIEVAGLACYAVLLWRALDQPSYGAGAAAQAFQDVTGRAPTRPVIALDAQPPRPAPAADRERAPEREPVAGRRT